MNETKQKRWRKISDKDIKLRKKLIKKKQIKKLKSLTKREIMWHINI